MHLLLVLACKHIADLTQTGSAATESDGALLVSQILNGLSIGCGHGNMEHMFGFSLHAD